MYGVKLMEIVPGSGAIAGLNTICIMVVGDISDLGVFLRVIYLIRIFLFTIKLCYY